MRRLPQTLALLALPISLCFAADVVTAVHGTVTKLDSAAKTVVVKTENGTEQTVHFGRQDDRDQDRGRNGPDLQDGRSRDRGCRQKGG